MKNLKFQIFRLTTPHSVHHSWVDELFNDTLYWNKRGEIKKKVCLCGDCWREAEQTWRNGIEEFEEEIGMVLKLGGSVMRVGREISVSEMVKIFCCFCSSRQCFFFFCAWIAHLTRSLHSTSSLLIFFGQRWCLLPLHLSPCVPFIV